MRVTLKVASKDDIQQEVDIYQQLVGIDGIPLVFGWSLFNPSFSYISMEPFTRDLYDHIQDVGPMCLGQACEVARTIVSVNTLLSIQDH